MGKIARFTKEPHTQDGGVSSSLLTRALPSAAATSLGSAASVRFYHENVREHFYHPRNVGKLDKKDPNVGTAVVGKASCGDVVQLQVQIEDGNVKDAKFKTFGCGSAIASSSLATEMIKGKSKEEAAKLKNTDISGYLKLPPVKIHCSLLVEEAVQKALDDYEQKQAKLQKSASEADLA